MRTSHSLLPLTTAFTFLLSCSTRPPVVPVPQPDVTIAPPAAPIVHGLTFEEEGALLRLEDRREFDSAFFERWAAHPNALHRIRAALALGRIGQATFVDTNSNNERDAGEKMAGVDILVRLAIDPDSSVRRAATFALGEIGDPAGVEALVTATRDAGHADVAAEAVEALSKLAASIDFSRYLPLTASGVPEAIRARAIRYLFRFNSDPASAVASSLLSATEDVIRREASYTLSRRAYAGARAALETALSDRDTLTRAYAARGLGLIAARESAEPLAQAMSDPHPWVRTNAARALALVGEKDPTALGGPTAAQNAVRATSLTSDPDPGTRITAGDVLALYARLSEPAKQHLFELAVKGSAAQREVAVGAIAKHFGSAAGSPLAALLQTDSPWIKVRALEASSTMPSGGPEMRRRYATDASPLVRARAITAIPDTAVDAERALITAALSDEDPIVRESAIDRLALSKKTSAGELYRLLSSAEQRGTDPAQNQGANDARLAAIRAIANLDVPEREAFLRQRLTDKDPVVRRAAADLLVEKLKRNRPQFTPLPIDRPLSDYIAISKWARERHRATIHTTRGKIELVLLPQDAPMTVKNFADLASRGYFDNTTFMRVVPNFVVQSGDPRNDQSGGPGYAIRDEINMQRYTRGAMGMALSGPDTGGSQFFITHSPQPHLDGGYTIFARVVDGMGGVVDQLERGDKVTTIKIDEVKATEDPDTSGVERTPLPTEVGTTSRARLLAIIPGMDDKRIAYQPDADIVDAIAPAIKPGDRIEVYLGTWCPDSEREVPRFLKILDLLKEKHGVEIPVSYVGVNRGKNEPMKLLEGRKIEKVATFIYYRDNTELGRIVEKPATVFEDEFLQIVSK